MQLHPTGSTGAAGIQLPRIGVDKQTHANVLVLEPSHQGAKAGYLGTHIQASFSRHLLAPFGHKSHHVGPDPQGDGLHGIRGGHLQVEAGANGGAQQLHIPILNVSAVLPQVNGDAIRPAQLGQ